MINQPARYPHPTRRVIQLTVLRAGFTQTGRSQIGSEILYTIILLWASRQNHHGSTEDVPLPSAPGFQTAPNVTVQPPLTYRGHGPGLVLLIPDEYEACTTSNQSLDPCLLQQWAEEGYAVAQVVMDSRYHSTKLAGDIESAYAALTQLKQCEAKSLAADKWGLICELSCSMQRLLYLEEYQYMEMRLAVDWLLPGIPPTKKPLRIPFTAVVDIRGDRLYHEHISWDQGTVLRQAGLLPEWLPFPYTLDGRTPGPGKRFEYRVPAAGAETAMKLWDSGAVPSNEMMGEYTGS